MTIHSHHGSRRQFLRQMGLAALGGTALSYLPRPLAAQSRPAKASRVALTAGETRGDNIHRALRLVEPQIRETLARKKRVLLKPNIVVTSRQLAATHADCLEAVLEFLSVFHKDEFVIADSSASGSSLEGFSNYGYDRLARKYKVRFMDFDDEPSTIAYVSDHRFHPQAVRMSDLLLDPETYIVSTAILKTHDRAVVTLSLKNVVVGAAKKDKTFRWGVADSGSNDKILIHGGPGNEAININLFQLARRLHPDLSVLDGFEGMEHNGPVSGTPVDHKVAVVSTDWLAADRVATELMGFDFNKVGYLSFAAKAGFGEGDLSRLEIFGEKVTNHIRHYRPHDRVEEQYKWMSRS
ncbi:MAG: DUF362 domain-containing protein [Phycisphaerae bacterium]